MATATATQKIGQSAKLASGGPYILDPGSGFLLLAGVNYVFTPPNASGQIEVSGNVQVGFNATTTITFTAGGPSVTPVVNTGSVPLEVTVPGLSK